jgi:KaiC/GvpD/RAD55 family RecA-like ATPase
MKLITRYMQNIETYAKESYLRLIVQGPPGVGKTTLGCHFPGAYIADCDINLAGPLRYLKEHNGTLPVGYDIIDRDENGNEVDPIQRYQRLTTCLTNASQDPRVQTIVIDSATKLSDYMLDEVMRQNKTLKMTIPLWGMYLALWKHFISQISAQRKHFVLICHERVEKDEIDQNLKYFIMVPGQMGQIIGSLFTDVWRCEVASGSGAKPAYSFNVRTMPDHRYQLKNSLGLPPVMKFDWKTIEEKLNT